MSLELSPPEVLTDQHAVDGFACGEPDLDAWLKQRALANQASGATRTFVMADGEGCVMAYYALAAGAVGHADAPGGIRRNMPTPIPVLVLARLAVDEPHQGRDIGVWLLRDAVIRAEKVRAEIGVRALLVHAMNDRAEGFYLKFGFTPSPTNPMHLLLKLGK